jgi:tetratricopeptide (TPR) repeat protein
MTPEQQEIYEEGRVHFEQGRFEPAARCFWEIVKDAPDRFADVYNKLGIIYHRKGLTDKAIAYLEKALKVNPAYTEAALNLSIVYNEIGRYEEAHKIFKRAVKTVSKTRTIKDPYIEGRLANEHARLGDQYYDLGRFKEAIAEYKKALKLRPKFPDISTQLGIAYRESGDLEAAIKTFAKTLDTHTRYLPAFLQLGLVYYMKGFVDMAILEWKEALAIDPENRDARIYLSFVSRARP